jgi:tetratricopeptide (TPR) repeat protein
MRRGPKGADAELDDVVTMGDSTSETDEGGKPLAMPLGVLAVSLFFLIGGALGSALGQTLHINILTVRPSWQATFSVAQKTYAESPLFGSGPGTFGVEWLKYRDTSLNTTQFWNIDFFSGIGYIPTSLITTGAVGMVAWIAFLGLLLVLGLRMVILRAPQDEFIRFVSILTLVASAYLFANAFFGLPNVVLIVLAFVMAGLFTSTTRYAAWSQQWGVVFSKSPRLGFVIVFSMTLLLLGAVVAAYNVAGRYVAISQVASATVKYGAGDLDGADRAAQQAASFGSSASAYAVQSAVALSRVNQIVSSSTMPAATARQAFQEALSAGINAGLTATRITPNDYRTWLAVGNLYAQAVPLGVSGAYDSAKSAYQKAFELNPTSPQIPFVMAQLDISAKNLTSAEDNLKKAITLKQDYTAAIFLLSQVEVQTGNVKDALAASLAAAYFQPNDPNILFQVGILYAAQQDYQNAGLALTAAVTANPQFANARYFLAAVLAKLNNLPEAANQLQAIADISPENAQAVATQLAALKSGKNPFPANLLSFTQTPVK